MTEPTISGNTVTEVVGNGKLVLQNVIGNNVTITKRGGPNKNYLVNNKGVDNYVQLDNAYNRDDEYWGRVEISPATGNATDQLLNVMYVCDADKNLSLKATAIETEVVKGAVFGKVVAVFVTSATRRASAFSFETTGSSDSTVDSRLNSKFSTTSHLYGEAKRRMRRIKVMTVCVVCAILRVHRREHPRQRSAPPCRW